MLSSPVEQGLLALPDSLRVVDIGPTREDPSVLCVLLVSQADAARCPAYQTLSVHRHERCHRILADLPCAGTILRLRIELWRYRCACEHCSRRTFVERRGSFAPERARRTDRMRQALQSIGLTDGGRAGERQANRLGLPVSYRTLLRLLHALPVPAVATPRVLGG